MMFLKMLWPQQLFLWKVTDAIVHVHVHVYEYYSCMLTLMWRFANIYTVESCVHLHIRCCCILFSLGEPSISGISPTYFVAGDTATLSCELIYNYPLSTVSWNQGQSASLDPQRFTVQSNGDLVISPIIPEDQQSITCNATNAIGVSSETVQLEVDVRPVVSFPYSSISVLLNTNLTVTCSVFSRPLSTRELVLPSGNKALSFQVC